MKSWEVNDFSLQNYHFSLVDTIYKSNKANKPVALIFFEKLELYLLTFFQCTLYCL